MVVQIIRGFFVFIDDIKIWHSIFALPFVLASFLLHSQMEFSWLRYGWIILCMVFARSFAMGANRYLDHEIDKKNPRTKLRAIPSGRLSPGHGFLWTMILGLGFVFSSIQISWMCGGLAFPVLIVLYSYPFIKRISYMCHFYLGLCLGMAPVGAEIALRSQVSSYTIVLGCALLFWTAGFDILYATQDTKNDLRFKVYSIPAHFGGEKSLFISKCLFFLMCIFLLLVGSLTSQNFIYYIGVLFVSGLLCFEHYLVKDIRNDQTSKNINTAFFNINALVSFVYLFFTGLSHCFS